MRKLFILGLLLFVLEATTVTARAQLVHTPPFTEYRLDTLARTYIHFRHDVGYIDSNYRNNAAALAAIRNAVAQIDSNSLNAVSNIIVEGSASPIGHPEYNRLLSLRRARTVGKFLQNLSGLQSVEINIVGNGEGWAMFTEDIRANYHRRNRTALLQILDDKRLSDQQRKEKIIAMEPDSLTWRILVRDYMGSSRNSVVVVVVKKERIIEPLQMCQPITARAETSENPSAVLIFTPGQESQQPAQEKPVETPQAQDKTPIFSARTNFLVPLLNAGVEVPLGNNWSVAADYYYPWIWPNQKNKNCFELLGWSMEGRYWFGRDRQPQDRLKGHSVGVYMAGGYYDFEKNYRGIQGEFLSPGLDYTYSMAVGKAKRVHLQFTLAVGYIRSWGRTYNVYGDYGALYPDDGTVIWDYFGPTKAAVSIVVPFYRKEDRR